MIRIITSLTILSSCKKGANDPFLSLHSRKARVAGDWTLKKADGTSTSGTSTTTSSFDGTTLTETSAGVSTKSTYSLKYKFDKKGTYTSTLIIDTDTWDETGTWNFTSGIGKDKNKDHIIIKTLTSTHKYGSTTTTSTYTGDDAGTFGFYLDELKNKTMVWKYDGSSTYSSGSKSSDMMTYTFAQ